MIWMVVKGRDGSAEELDRETGEEQTTVGRTRRKDGRWRTTGESGRVMWGGQEETREAKDEMGGLCKERCEEGRRGGRLEEEDKRQRRVEKTIRWGGEEVASSTSPLTKEKEEERPTNILHPTVLLIEDCTIDDVTFAVVSHVLTVTNSNYHG